MMSPALILLMAMGTHLGMEATALAPLAVGALPDLVLLRVRRTILGLLAMTLGPALRFPSGRAFKAPALIYGQHGHPLCHRSLTTAMVQRESPKSRRFGAIVTSMARRDLLALLAL